MAATPKKAGFGGAAAARTFLSQLMNRIALALGLTVFFVLPAALEAQACVGVPQGSQRVASFAVQFPSSGTDYEIGGLAMVGESLYAGASVGVTTFDYPGAKDATNFGARVGYEIPSLLETASVCPGVGLGYTTYGGVDFLTVPLSLGIGTTLQLGADESTTLTPYIAPQLLWTRTSANGYSDSDTSLGFNGGATVGFGPILGGAFVSKLFEDGNDFIFGIQAGYVF